MTADILNIPGLTKVSLDVVFHPNPKLLDKLRTIESETYILDGTKYGLWINSDLKPEPSYSMIWFGFIYKDGKFRVNSTIEFGDLINDCPKDFIDPLLFNLNIFIKND